MSKLNTPKLSPAEIQNNWIEFISNIETYITGDRRDKMLDLYKSLEDRLILYPASNKSDYHSCYPGGYVVHVNNVVRMALSLCDLWERQGADISTFTKEELVFSAINHDLGKIGNLDYEAYLPSEDKWRKENLNEHYVFNKNLPFMKVPDRSIFILSQSGIKFTENEMIAILTHDGLYDEANNPYLKGYLPELKPRTSLVYILHQADMMAARIEFEEEWGGTFSNKSTKKVKKTINKDSGDLKTIKSKTLSKFFNEL